MLHHKVEKAQVKMTNSFVGMPLGSPATVPVAGARIVGFSPARLALSVWGEIIIILVMG